MDSKARELRERGRTIEVERERARELVLEDERVEGGRGRRREGGDGNVELLKAGGEVR